MKKTVLLFFGTRPEAIKMAPVVSALKKDGSFRVIVAVSAQHRGMLDQVLSLFGLKSDIDMNVMRPGQTLYQLTSRVLTGIEPVLDRYTPDLVLVHGDTTTTLAGAVGAFYRRIPVGHVEAGLRTNDLYRPFPEEANRRLTDALSALHFSPTREAAAHLLAEGTSRDKIFVTGNTVIDALKRTAMRPRPVRSAKLRAALAAARRDGGRIILMTAHRRENFGRPFDEAFSAIRGLSAEIPDAHWIYPVHPNPNVIRAAKKHLGGRRNIHLVEPLDYGDLVSALRQSTLVVTDSGGLQEEAPSLGKPVLVLRDVTERPEAVRAGTVRLVGTNARRIRASVLQLLNDSRAHSRMANAVNPYGDGRAAERIVSAIRYFFGLSRRRPAPFGKRR